MNSLVFLLVKSAKNTLLELRRKPAKLALWVLVIAGIGGIFLLSLFTRQSATGSLDLVWLKGILFLLIAHGYGYRFGRRGRSRAGPPGSRVEPDGRTDGQGRGAARAGAPPGLHFQRCGRRPAG